MIRSIVLNGEKESRLLIPEELSIDAKLDVTIPFVCKILLSTSLLSNAGFTLILSWMNLLGRDEKN